MQLSKLNGHEILRLLPLPLWLSQVVWHTVFAENEPNQLSDNQFFFLIAHMSLVWLTISGVSIYLVDRYGLGKWLIVLALIPGLSFLVYLGVAFGSARKRYVITEHKQNPATDIAAKYSMQYVLDHGHNPSRETVLAWLVKLNALKVEEMLRLASDPNGLKRFLS